MIIDLIKDIKQIGLKEFKTLLTGTVIAQAITLAALPILTKLYSPQQFGEFALFFSIANAIGIVSAGRFDAALMLPKQRDEAQRLFIAGFISCSLISIIALFVLVFTPSSKTAGTFLNISKHFNIFTALAIFLTGSFVLLSSIHNRDKSYKEIAQTKIAQNIAIGGLSIIFGLLSFGTKGLIVGFILGLILSCFLLFRKSKISIFPIQKKSILPLIKKFKSFPLYSVPMVFLNSISLNILIFLLTSYVGSSFVGLYSQAFKAVNFPLFIISSSFAPLFFEKATNSENKMKLVSYSLGISLIVGFTILSPLLIWGESLFGFVFGENWRISGKIAALLIPLTVTSFAATNISNIFAALHKNFILLVWQIIYLLLSCVLFYYLRNNDKMDIISLYSWFGTIMYIMLFGIIFMILKVKK